ncbi:MAG: hypothetical protein JXA33_24665 [Anaerolineae bacterium]|nr:hypothetical protein [Anaerolineae bacterium]
MSNKSELIKTLVEKISTCNDFEIVHPIAIGEGLRRNELLLFIKPELFMVEQPLYIERGLELVFTKLEAFNAHVSGVAIVGGRVLEQKEIMNRHYGFINRLSRFASQMIDGVDRAKIADALNVASLATYTIYGGHEYLAAYPDEDCFALDTLWFTKKSIKIRSGFYVQAYEKEDKNIILVNGFHPAQLMHFTDPTHRIVLVLLHADTDWVTLRNEMVGATFPEKAVPHSIRGTLYAQAEYFGLGEVSIANNGVHLSAGPFEGMFEIVNFFGNLLDFNVENTPPFILQKMREAGLTIEEALAALDNPIVSELPKPIDLFTATEDVNTEEAVSIWKKALA